MTQHPNSSAPASSWRPWRTILVCAAAGPLFGLVVFSVSMAIISSLQLGWSYGIPFLLGIIHPFGWAGAVFIGGIPAAFGAAICTAIDRFAPRPVPRVPVAAAVGWAVTVLVLLSAGFDSNKVLFAFAFGLIGAASGMVCALLTRRWRYVPPTNDASPGGSPPASPPS